MYTLASVSVQRFGKMIKPITYTVSGNICMSCLASCPKSGSPCTHCGKDQVLKINLRGETRTFSGLKSDLETLGFVKS